MHSSILKWVAFGALYALMTVTTLAQMTRPPFAAINDQVLTYNPGGDTSATELVRADDFRSLVWNADGTQLAFAQATDVQAIGYIWEVGVNRFGAADEPIETFILQTERPAAGFPLNWTQDDRILFAVETEGAVMLMAASSTQTETLGTVPYAVGCGGGAATPADMHYNVETGSLGGFFLTLEDTPYGIVYSASCAGTELARFNPETGDAIIIASDFSKAIVAPDGRSVAGLAMDMRDRTPTALVVLDLETGEQQTIQTEAQPDQLAWNADGKAIYYSTRAFERDLVDTLDDDERTTLETALDYMPQLPAYHSALYHVDIESGTNTLVYSADVHAIPRFFETDDALYISQIANLDGYLAALMGGELDPFDTDAVLNSVPVEVMRIERAGTSFGEASLLGNFRQFTPYAR